MGALLVAPTSAPAAHSATLRRAMYFCSSFSVDSNCSDKAESPLNTPSSFSSLFFDSSGALPFDRDYIGSRTRACSQASTSCTFSDCLPMNRRTSSFRQMASAPACSCAYAIALPVSQDARRTA